MFLYPHADRRSLPIRRRALASTERLGPLPRAVLRVGIGCLPILHENPQSSSIKILELTRPQGPEKTDKAHQAQQQRDRDQDRQTVHPAADLSLSALATTMIDEPDIASAATNGVTNPAKASGTARPL